MINPLARSLLQNLLPSHCFLCLKKCETLCCIPCSTDLPWIVNACYNCGIPLSQDQCLDGDSSICGHCLKTPPSYNRCIPAFLYDTPIDSLISKFKNHRDLTAGHALSTFLWKQISIHMNHSEYPDIITPVPLHWRRQLTRSFNQSAFIAQQLSRHSGIPAANISKRVTATPKQQRLKRSQRLKNLKGTFQVDGSKVANKKVAIIDDVMTTGATVESLSAALKKAGALQVEVWCLGRTPNRSDH